MPLVVPGLQNKAGDDKTSKWMNELMGKKIGDQSNETVSYHKDENELMLTCASDICKEGSPGAAQDHREGWPCH